MKNESTERELTLREYIRRESGSVRAPYDPEIMFYNTVRSGDVERTAALCACEPFSGKKGLGVLSDDPVKNVRYHFIITAAMLARVCIEGGMELSLAYTLSDYYIRRADQADTVDEIDSLHPAMCADYAERMKGVRRGPVYSRHVSVCVEYIYDHLHTRITLGELAALCGISPEHLSRVFKKETGMSVSAYIAGKKLETAENMLAYSDHPIAYISQILAFSDQSYFTECFRKRTGMTPLAYRSSRGRRAE